jgi:hypothetical protein
MDEADEAKVVLLKVRGLSSTAVSWEKFPRLTGGATARKTGYEKVRPAACSQPEILDEI